MYVLTKNSGYRPTLGGLDAVQSKRDVRR